MNIVKIGILGITAVFCAMTVKEQKPQFAVVISVAACILIFYSAISRLQTVAELLESLTSYTAIKASYLAILLKIVGISYISDFSASICRDSGYQAIAGQIEIFGKMAILTVSTPVVLALFNTVTDFLS